MAHFLDPLTLDSVRPSGRARLAALALGLVGAASTATAQQGGSSSSINPGGPGGPRGTEWGLGIGVIAKQDAYRGIQRETQVVPLLRLENEYVEFAGLGLEVKLPGVRIGEGSRLKFGIVAEAELSGYEAKDAPILAGMAERKHTLWVGAKATWESDLGELSAEWAADASGHSKGRKFSLGVAKEFHLGEQTMLVPYIAANWLDKKYVDYYYGVRAAEATAGRPAYLGASGVNLDIGLRAMYRFEQRHAILFDVGVTRLATQVKASPLVGRSSTNQVIVGYMYSF